MMGAAPSRSTRRMCACCRHTSILSQSTSNRAMLKVHHAMFDLSHVCTAASVVYKSKSVQVTSAGDQEFYNRGLFWIALLIGAVLYAHPYSLQSPALKDCLTHLCAQPESDLTPTPPDTHFTLGNLSQHSNSGTEQQQSSQHEEPAQSSASSFDQQSSSASCDPHLLAVPHPPGGPHSAVDPHPAVDPQPPELTTVHSGQQNRSSPSSEASNPVSSRQPQTLTQADLRVFCSDTLCATPSESMWADIHTVALRALVTLHWATTASPYVSQMLAKVVHALLIGHVMDPKLDMTLVLRFGLTAVLGALLQIETHESWKLTERCLRHLACLFLRRLRTDRRAFQALYGRRAHDMDVLNKTERLTDYPAIKSLWSLLRKTLSVLTLPAVLVLSHLTLIACLQYWLVCASVASHYYLLLYIGFTPHAYCVTKPLQCRTTCQNSINPPHGKLRNQPHDSSVCFTI